MVLNHPAIHRLARRAGVKRLSSSTRRTIQAKAERFLQDLLHDVVIYAEHARRITILTQDIRWALKRKGMEVYGY